MSEHEYEDDSGAVAADEGAADEGAHELDAFNPEFGANLQARLEELEEDTRQRLEEIFEPLSGGVEGEVDQAGEWGPEGEWQPAFDPEQLAAGQAEAEKLLDSLTEELGPFNREAAKQIANEMFPHAVGLLGEPSYEAAEQTYRAAAAHVAMIDRGNRFINRQLENEARLHGEFDRATASEQATELLPEALKRHEGDSQAAVRDVLHFVARDLTGEKPLPSRSIVAYFGAQADLIRAQQEPGRSRRRPRRRLRSRCRS